MAHSVLKNYTEAMKCFEIALSINRNSTLALVNKGRIYMQQDDLKRALVCFNIAISIDPKCQDAIYNRALILYQQDEIDESIRNFKKLSLEDDIAQTCWQERGQAFTLSNRLDDAIESLDKCMAIRDDTHQYRKALLVKASTLSRMQRHKEAIPLYSTLISLKKGDVQILSTANLHMGVSHYYLKKYDKAVKILRKGIEIDPTRASLYDNCGVSLKFLKKLVIFFKINLAT